MLGRCTPPPQGCPQGLLPSPLLSLNAHPAPWHPNEDATRTKTPRVSLTSLRAPVTGRPGAEGSRKQSECGQCSASRGTDHGDRLGQGRWDSAQRESRRHAEGPLRGGKATGSGGCWSPSVGNTSHLTVGRTGSSRGPGLEASVLGARPEARPEPPQALFIFRVILSRLLVHPFHQHRQTLRCRQPGGFCPNPGSTCGGPEDPSMQHCPCFRIWPPAELLQGLNR